MNTLLTSLPDGTAILINLDKVIFFEAYPNNRTYIECLNDSFRIINEPFENIVTLLQSKE